MPTTIDRTMDATIAPTTVQIIGHSNATSVICREPAMVTTVDTYTV